MPPRMYAKHKSTSKGSEYNTKRGIHTHANIKGTYTKSSQRATLAEVEARLAQAVDFDEAELRSQALAQAEDDRRTRLASLGDRIRSYHVRL